MAAILTGNTGYGNRGVEALFTPIVEQLQQKRPDLEVMLLSNSPAYDRFRFHVNKGTVVQDAYQRLGRLARVPKLMRPLAERLGPGLKPQNDAIRTADVIIASGGDLFGSDYGFKMHIPPLKLGIDAGRPVVFLAHSIGPFKKQEQADLFMSIAKNAALVTLRESLSYEYVTKTLGLDNRKVHLAGDTAFLLDPTPQDEAERMLVSYGFDLDRPIFCAAISQKIANYLSEDSTKHFEAWKKVIEFALNELGAQVALIPHVQGGNGDNDDRIVQTNLQQALGWDPRVRQISGDHSARDYKAMIRRAGFVIGERMHACIGALSLCTPTLTVQYSVKAQGINKDLFGDKVEEYGTLIAFEDLVQPERALPVVRRAWEHRPQMEERLNITVPEMRTRSASNFEHLSALL